MKKIIITLGLLCSLPCYAELNIELPINAKSAPLIAKMMESEDLSDSNLNDANVIDKKITFKNNTLTFERVVRPIHQNISEDEIIKLFQLSQEGQQKEICANKRYNQLNQYINMKYIYQLLTRPPLEIDLPVKTCQASDIQEFDPEYLVIKSMKHTMTSLTLPKKLDEFTTLIKAELDEKQKQVTYYNQIDIPKDKFSSPEFKELTQMAQEHVICNNDSSLLLNQFIHLKYVFTLLNSPKHQVVVTIPKQLCQENKQSD